MHTKREPRLSTFFSPIADAHDDGLTTTNELASALDREHVAHQLDALGAQRWIRVLTGVLCAALVLLTARARAPLPALVATVLAYGALTLGVARLCRSPRVRGATNARWIPALTIAIDLVAFTALLVGTGALGAHAVLVLAPLFVFAGSLYLDWRLALVAASASLGIYVAIVIRRPGPADPELLLRDGGLFAIVSAIITWEIARRRHVVRELRLFCRQVAGGDIGLRLPAATERRAMDMVPLARDIDAMRRGLAEQIGVDPLTGCLNRRALESRLRGEWRLARRRHTTVAVVAIDIDHFKRINDGYGHPAGDLVLQQFAAIMRSVTRESDAVARLGGDEFVLILPDTDAEGVQVLAERLRQRVSTTRFGEAEHPLNVTVSVGATYVHGRDELTAAEILAQADRALYRSKQQGRNRVSYGALSTI